MAKERKTDNGMEEDRVVLWLMEVVEYIRQKQQVFVGGVIGIVALVVVINLVNSSQQDARIDAETMLGDVLVAEGNAQDDTAVSLCEQLIEQYAGTPAAAQGLVLLGNRYFAQDRFDEALSMYERFLADYGKLEILLFAAWSGVAATYEAQGRLLEAAQKYQEYADNNPESYQSSLALMEAARCFALGGDEDAGRQVLERVTIEYAESPVATRAKQENNML